MKRLRETIFMELIVVSLQVFSLKWTIFKPFVTNTTWKNAYIMKKDTKNWFDKDLTKNKSFLIGAFHPWLVNSSLWSENLQSQRIEIQRWWTQFLIKSILSHILMSLLSLPDWSNAGYFARIHSFVIADDGDLNAYGICKSKYTQRNTYPSISPSLDDPLLWILLLFIVLGVCE